MSFISFPFIITIFTTFITTSHSLIKQITFYYRNGFIFIPIQLGIPPQHFNVLFDTTSFHLYIANSTLKDTFPSTYSSHLSTSYEETDSTIYQLINQRGIEIQDYISFIGNHLTLSKKFHFILLNTATTLPFTGTYIYDGVFGFARCYPGNIIELKGHRNIAAHPRFSMVQYLYVNELISTKKMEFHFNTGDSGVLTFGYDDSEYKDNITYCNIDNIPSYINTFWLCKSQNVIDTTHNIVLYNKSFYIVIESVYDGIKLPQDIGVRLLRSIEDAFPNVLNYKIGVNQLGVQVFYPYNNMFNIHNISNYTLTINDALTLHIKGKDLFTETAVEISGRQMHGYRSLFLFGPNIKEVYLGIPFMKRYHIVFDSYDNRIGFGKYINDDILTKTSNTDIWAMPHNKNNNTHYYYTHIVIILILIIIIIIYIWLIYHHRRKRRKQRKHQQQHQHRININNHISTIRTHVATSIDPLGTPMLTLEPS